MHGIPAAWMPRVPMKRFHGHWTAGGHKANSTDVKAYHLLWEGEGKAVRGVDIAKNSGRLHDGYAAHTLNANTDAIGGSMCGMMGAVEVPFNPGTAPLTRAQWDAFVRDSAQVLDFYNIPIGKKTSLFHDEVPIHLGIPQRQKWDVSVLPFDMSVRGAVQIGDKWRDEMRAYTSGVTPFEPEPIPAGGIARVTTAGLNLRRGAGASFESRGELPAGTLLELVGGVSGDWIEVRTPAGFDGWVNRAFVQMVDGPPPVEPTRPDPRRETFARIRADLDALEASL